MHRASQPGLLGELIAVRVVDDRDLGAHRAGIAAAGQRPAEAPGVHARGGVASARLTELAAGWPCAR